uniref:ATP synthase subunit a n=1 Tax=Proales similis TaxID=360698 RepID=A0A7D5AU27_9BILA|nr:ATP synthase F0 subunit 6 [Proales similis]
MISSFELMLALLLSVFSLILVVSFLFYSFFTSFGRFSALKHLLLDLLSSVANSLVSKFLFFFLVSSFLTSNLLGNIPLEVIPTQYYAFTFTFSLLFWIPIIVSVCYTDFKNFFAHLLPYGAPSALMLFLPLVELFSQLIRPLTLMIRLSTNLAAGHIMMFMFSYFVLLSDVLALPIYVVLYLLYFLELAISALQAYIFTSLLTLYVAETL